MDTLFKSPVHGQTSSKRVISMLFCVASIIGAFCAVDPQIVITFALISGGSQALATKKLE